MDGNAIRNILLTVVSELASGPHASSLQSTTILYEAVNRIGAAGSRVNEQALLTLFYDLFRNGHLSWGLNLANPDSPFCHVTEQGRTTLASLSRDPANPDGYLRHLSSLSSLNPITHSYVSEALTTYNANCFKATAVMIGAASESVVLELRDQVIARMTILGKTPSTNLQSWQIKKVLDALQSELKAQTTMPKNLAEMFQSYWPAFTQQIRVVRNDSGHPTSIIPVTQDVVHASLLIFPELAKMASKLNAWIPDGYR